MGKKSQKFIDKGKAVTYTLVAAPDGEGSSGRMFVRTDDNDVASPLDNGEEEVEDPSLEPSSGLDEAKRAELMELGFPDDGYDYLQHLKEMDNEGTPGVHFIPADEPPKQLAADERDYDVRGAHEPEAACSVPPVPPTVSNDMEEKHELKSAIKEMKSLALRAEGAPEGEGDLQDDFVMEAMMAPEGQDDGDEVQEGLPSDAPKAEARSYQRRLGLLGVLDAQFERLALDYDDDNIGELDDGNVQSAGGQPDSALLGQAMEDFEERLPHKPDLHELAPDGMRILTDDERAKVHQALSSKDEEDVSKSKARELADVQAYDEGDADPDDVAGRAVRQWAERESKGQWDIESWASASTTMANGPAILSTKKARNKRGTGQVPDRHSERVSEASEAIERIRLNKEGMPIDYMGTGNDKDRTPSRKLEPVGEWSQPGPPPRRKGETKEEKKERKRVVKEARRETRQAKKQSRSAFAAASQETASVRSNATVHPSASVVSLSS